MRRLIFATFAALSLATGVLVAPPASASHCNWSCPTNVDEWEYRPTPKITAGTAWSIGNTTQDACYMLIVNNGTAGHYMRIQIIKRSTGSVIYDTGFHGIWLDAGGSAVRNPHIAAEPISAEIYVKFWNDVGDVTYNDYWFNTSDDTNTLYPPDHYDCS